MAKKYVFGSTPWGQYFINAMEMLADEGRLARGRSYAGSGMVSKIRIKDNVVEAKVKGSYRPFYQVDIVFKKADKKTADAIHSLLDKDPILASRIQAGDLPDDFLKSIEKKGGSLLPKRWADMQRSCSCPDWGDPCKHEAAVYYIIAQEIDRKPSLVFSLRGLDISAFRKEAVPGNFIKLPEIKLVKPWAYPAFQKRPVPPLTDYSQFLLSLLPPSRGLCPFDLKNHIAAFYHRVKVFKTSLAAETENMSMDDATARLWRYGHSSLLFTDDLEIFVSGPDKRRWKLLDLYLWLPRWQDDNTDPSYSFLLALFSIFDVLIDAGAVVPVLYCDEKDFWIRWKPAELSDELRALANSVIEYCPPSIFKSGAKIPDKSTTVALAIEDFFVGVTKTIAYRPSSSVEASHPLVIALFLSVKVPYRNPGMESLPQAAANWFNVFNINLLECGFELKLKNSPKDESAFYLSATFLDGDGTRRKLSSAATYSNGRLALEQALVFSGFLPAIAKLSKTETIIVKDDDLAVFILDASGLLSRLGVKIIVPKELHKILRPRRVLEAKKRASVKKYLDIKTAFSFSWQAAIGDDIVSTLEFLQLLKKGMRLVHWKGNWVRVDPDEASKIMAALESGKSPGFMEAVRAVLDGETIDGNAFRLMLEDLSPAGSGKIRKKPEGLLAEFRPYQERGYRWLLSIAESGLGCVLADDMGLGKTVQALALVLARKEAGELEHGALVIAPASLLGNWEKETEKFAPGLKLDLHYGSSRKQKKTGADIVLSSYETWIRDAEKNRDRIWDILVLDEAHYIKNHASKRAMAIKKTNARCRIALTGTPVENNLAELWSIFDFALPSYLGKIEDFSKTYRIPIEQNLDADRAAGLRKICSPFMLRRLKTDPVIAADLPDKISIDEYAIMPPGQAALYTAVSEEGLARIENADMEDRLGLILALITALKQVSNHPANYSPDETWSATDSGKARLLVALLENAFDSGERVLVFSQYVTMLNILNHILVTELGIKPYMLHGSMKKAERDRSVAEFQAETGPAVFLISLKAGGVGLNLTNASRVIHYDLWFNPATENQATDRAFRIGQKQNVFVHRFITRGSLEEKINTMINDKKALSELTVRAGESWLGDLSNKELAELFSLTKS